MDHHSIHHIAEQQREFFLIGTPHEIGFRREQLKRLQHAITDHETHIFEALQKDLGKPQFEAYGGEVFYALQELHYAIKHLNSWTRPRKVRTPLLFFPGSSYRYPEPYGSVLIISPGNYPFQLTLLPLIGAMAAGNCAVIKPSEMAPHSSALLADILNTNFDPSYLAVIEGEIEETQALLAQHFDYIFFTGGARVGKIVMEVAARHVTPLTLELGGKSPCIVDQDVDLTVAARRIVWGKFFNAGQSCVAPDYVFAHTAIKSALLDRMKTMLVRFYGQDPFTSPDYARIINDAHFARLAVLLKQGEIVAGGRTDAESRYIAPTILDKISWEHDVMQDEIFGPILPVLEYKNLDDVITTLRSQPKPLALYFFSNTPDNQRRILRETSSGGACINDTLDHMLNNALPFGGVGSSGMGSYHGKASFDTFSHYKSVLKRATWLDPPIKYPPYTLPLRYLKTILKLLS